MFYVKMQHFIFQTDYLVLPCVLIVTFSHRNNFFMFSFLRKETCKCNYVQTNQIYDYMQNTRKTPLYYNNFKKIWIEFDLFNLSSTHLFLRSIKLNLKIQIRKCVLPSIPSMLWFVRCSSPRPRSVLPPLKTLEMLDTLGALFLSQIESSNKV